LLRFRALAGTRDPSLHVPCRTLLSAVLTRQTLPRVPCAEFFTHRRIAFPRIAVCRLPLLRICRFLRAQRGTVAMRRITRTAVSARSLRHLCHSRAHVLYALLAAIACLRYFCMPAPPCVDSSACARVYRSLCTLLALTLLPAHRTMHSWFFA
jgi:hypothetical protein